ncbi:MAG: thioredoxin domain-containing protein, partial [Rhodococcus sp.]|nr:thioredoxin domain-containing protein [Rhodococcus sp. (in: high G+C Gram-positive bacteria)]
MTSTSRSTRRRDLVLLAIAVVVAAVLVGALVLGTTGDGEQSEAAPDAGSSSVSGPPAMGPLGDLAHREPDDPMALGDVEAPVVMIAFSDFRCPFCAQFSRETEPQLIDRYVDTGTLRIEWRDLPIFGPQSFDSARAERAAAAHG